MTGEELRQRRCALGLSRERLAVSANCSSSTIRRLEEGAVPKVSTLRGIARELGIPLSELLGDAA